MLRRVARLARGVAVTALLCASVLFALALAELGLRVARPDAASRIEYPCFYLPDARTGFRYAPNGRGHVSGHFEIDNEVALNSLGFYDDEPADAARVGLRVLAVGDSFTAALNVPRDQVWTAVLERELRARGYADADVVNLGLDGTGTDVQLELLREYVPRLRPQVVLLAFFANDIEDVQNGRFTRECYRDTVLSYQTPVQRDALRARVDAHAQRRVLRALADHSLLARLALTAWEGPRTLFRLNFLQPSRAELGITPELLRERAPRGRESFEALARFAERCECGLVVVPVPARRELEASLALARGVSVGLPLQIVDVLPGIRAALARDGCEPSDLFFRYDAHLNDYGNRLFAEAVADAIDWRPRGAAAVPVASSGAPPPPSAR